MATIRDNEFSFLMTGLSNFKFEIQDYCITDGQPWEGIDKIECGDTQCTINVRAGRKGSDKVSNWFKDKIKGGSAIGCDTYDSLPGSLNFAFIGKMSFTHGGKKYSGENIVIAQGHNARSRNNWWIGGKEMAEITKIEVVQVAAIAQTFKQDKILPCKVFFATSIGHVSSMNMGLVGL